MLDHLHYGGGFKSTQPLVAVGQRSLNQLDSAALPFWKFVESQALLRRLQRTPRHVHAEDAFELFLR